MTATEDPVKFEFDTYALEIEWDRPSSDMPALPSLVGPFATRDAANEWASLNIPNGSWQVCPLAWPHWISPSVAYRRGVNAAMQAVAGLAAAPNEHADRVTESKES